MTELAKQSEQAFFPGRSKYQLEHFVIGQHPTKPMQWKQVLIEAQSLIYDIKMTEFDLQLKKAKLEKLSSKSDEISRIKAAKVNLEMQMTLRVLEGAKLELKFLEEIAETIGMYSLEKIEADQPDYWHARLSRQAEIDVLAATKGVSQGNLTSMLNAGLIEWRQDDCNTSLTS